MNRPERRSSLRGFRCYRLRGLLLTLLLAAIPSVTLAQDPKEILLAAFDNWRAESSHGLVEMVIKRTNSERRMTLESWTKGTDKALVRFIAPKRDAGNGTLQIGRSTWVYNPKLNQVIKLPASAMSQSWMGSDFSYNDLAKSDQIIDDYTHKLIARQSSGGHRVFVIEAVPKRGKPIVWGKQVVGVRDDGVLMFEEFYDQRGRLVRKMTTDRIGVLGGRPYPVVLTMRTIAKKGQFTRITTKSAEFGIPLPAWVFTKSNLQNPRT
ncbi:MAG: outer membrane lipoprotein-sorting protein [Paracoccaceae bacterium]